MPGAGAARVGRSPRAGAGVPGLAYWAGAARRPARPAAGGEGSPRGPPRGGPPRRKAGAAGDRRREAATTEGGRERGPPPGRGRLDRAPEGGDLRQHADGEPPTAAARTPLGLYASLPPRMGNAAYGWPGPPRAARMPAACGWRPGCWRRPGSLTCTFAWDSTRTAGQARRMQPGCQPLAAGGLAAGGGPDHRRRPSHTMLAVRSQARKAGRGGLRALRETDVWGAVLACDRVTEGRLRKDLWRADGLSAAILTFGSHCTFSLVRGLAGGGGG